MVVLRSADIKEIVKQLAEEMEKRTDRLMNLEDVSVLLGKKVTAVKKMCERKQLPHHNHHGSLYFSLREIQSHLLER